MAADQIHTSWHVLNFHIDDEADSVLTAWSDGSKYHVIASQEQLGQGTAVAKDFSRLVRAIQGAGNGEKHSHGADQDSSSDSGVDVRSSDKSAEEVKPQSDEEALQQWMMSPLVENLGRPATQDQKLRKHRTLEEWYHAPLNFYQLQASKDGNTVEAVEAESTPELDKWMNDLLPRITLPKSLTNRLEAPWFKGSELEVLHCSEKPVGTPYHPFRVRHRESGKTYFLKIVDNDQPQPFNRELDILHRIQQARLHEQMNVPFLQGLVTFDDVAPTSTGQKSIMGMLLTEIKGATPLTMKLDKDVPQDKRERWAREADRIKDILHEHEIIWGDAKADNFMVDNNDKLWIIDFGGSYTEGWIDPELNETAEGDDMGTEKIVNALQDPVANVQDPDDEEVDEGDDDDGEVETSTIKRAAVASKNRKKRKRSNETDEDDSPGKPARIKSAG